MSNKEEDAIATLLELGGDDGNDTADTPLETTPLADNTSSPELSESRRASFEPSIGVVGVSTPSADELLEEGGLEVSHQPPQSPPCTVLHEDEQDISKPQQCIERQLPAIPRGQSPQKQRTTRVRHGSNVARVATGERRCLRTSMFSASGPENVLLHTSSLDSGLSPQWRLGPPPQSPPPGGSGGTATRDSMKQQIKVAMMDTAQSKAKLAWTARGGRFPEGVSHKAASDRKAVLASKVLDTGVQLMPLQQRWRTPSPPQRACFPAARNRLARQFSVGAAHDAGAAAHDSDMELRIRDPQGAFSAYCQPQAASSMPFEAPPVRGAMPYPTSGLRLHGHGHARIAARKPNRMMARSLRLQGSSMEFRSQSVSD